MLCQATGYILCWTDDRAFPPGLCMSIDHRWDRRQSMTTDKQRHTWLLRGGLTTTELRRRKARRTSDPTSVLLPRERPATRLIEMAGLKKRKGCPLQNAAGCRAAGHTPTRCICLAREVQEGGAGSSQLHNTTQIDTTGEPHGFCVRQTAFLFLFGDGCTYCAAAAAAAARGLPSLESEA